MSFTAEDRRKAVGMSDMATLLGHNPYKQPVELWLEYTGRAPIGDELGAPTPTNRAPLYWGTMNERNIALGFSDYMTNYRGEPVTVRKDGREYTKPEHRSQCHLDYRIVGEDSGVECKNSGSKWAGDWGEPHTDNIPDMYLIQVHGQFWHVKNLDRIYVPRLAGWDFEVYEVERVDGWGDLFADALAQFWYYVDNDKQPPLDFNHRTITETIRKLHPEYNGEIVFLDDSCQEWTDLAKALGSDRLALEKAENVYRNRIRDAMGNNSWGVLPDGQAWRRMMIEREDGSEYPDFRRITKSKLPAAVRREVEFHEKEANENAGGVS